MSSVAIVTYSTKPRGGVSHTLHLADALHDLGRPVHVFSLGDPEEGFYRPLRAPYTLFPAPGSEGSLTDRVYRAADALAAGLRAASSDFDVIHVQDCIAASAVLRLREEGLRTPIVRTVHHVDDFTTPALVDCQRRSIVEPDHVLVVSEYWREALHRHYGVEATVVPSGVDAGRFRRPSHPDGEGLRTRAGARGRFLFLTVGGIEPRKGSMELIEAMARLRAAVDPPPVLAVVGGHSFQDHSAYRERALARARDLGLEVGRGLAMLGTVPDDELPRWYWASDAFVFPSVNEGFGLVVLEAMAASLPVVATDIPVFREYLDHGRGAVLAPPGDTESLAREMERLVRDRAHRARLAETAPAVAGRFTWENAARAHVPIYDRAAEGTRARA